MRGLYDELRETTLALHIGQIDRQFGVDMLAGAARRLEELRKRNARGHYTDEIQEIETAMEELQAEVDAGAPGVRIFHRPGRNVEVKVAGAPAGRGRLPDIQVVRIGQVEFIELDGRLRVRDWWELRIDGKSLSPPVEGPKRWIMKNAAGAACMDALGKPPAHLLLDGLPMRRAMYKLRRDKRREADRRRRMRLAKKAFARAVRQERHGLVVFAGVAGYIPIGGNSRERVLRDNVRIAELEDVAARDVVGRG